MPLLFLLIAQQMMVVLLKIFGLSHVARTPYTVMFYLSTAIDYLRATEAVYVGEITTSQTVGTYTNVAQLPAVLAPVPQVGNSPKNSAFYVPSGKALWATVKIVTPIGSDESPIIGAQGGFY